MSKRTGKKRAIKQVSGEHVFYAYLQNELQQSDPELFADLIASMVTRLGIWIHPDTYAQLPVLVPHALRGRRRSPAGASEKTDNWGEANSAGFVIDDNTLIKSMVRSRTILSEYPHYRNMRVGNSYWASHVWDEVTDGSGVVSRAVGDQRLHSFVPNLVWLPSQLSKLSDRSGSVMQDYLRAVSYSLYRDIEVPESTRAIVEEIWDVLPCPETHLRIPDKEELSFFEHSDGFIKKRKDTIRQVVEVAEAILSGDALPDNGFSPSKYPPSLAQRDRAVVQELLIYIRQFVQ